MSILENIGAGLVTIAIAVAGFFGYTPEQAQAPDENLGSDTQTFFGGQTYTLAGTGISSSASSFTLTSFTITQNGKKIQDEDMADTFYGTFEPGSRSRQEFFSCTTVAQNSDGTALISGCSRGLSPITPYTASTSLQFAHGGGTSVIFSNTPQFYDQFAAKGNDEVITGDWTVPSPAGLGSVVNYGTLLSTITGTTTIQTDKLTVAGIAGEVFATSSVVFFQESDARWYKLDVDDTAHFVDREIGIAQGPGTVGTNISGGVVIRGNVAMSGLTAGANYFASSTAGATSTATTSQAIGVARSTTQLYVNPDIIDSTVTIAKTVNATTTFTIPPIGTVRVTEYTSSSTYSVPATVKFIDVEMWGGGAGAGGGADAYGGGGGAYVFNRIPVSKLGSTATISVGVGGLGLSGTSGGNASSTYFIYGTTTLIAFGGAGGGTPNGGGVMNHGTSTSASSSIPYLQGHALVSPSSGVPVKSYYGGGAGGTTNGSNYASPGGSSVYGGGGGGSTRNANAIFAIGGTSAMGGNGGDALDQATGENGDAPGGGGGTGTSVGGRGASGMVRITEYY